MKTKNNSVLWMCVDRRALFGDKYIPVCFKNAKGEICLFPTTDLIIGANIQVKVYGFETPMNTNLIKWEIEPCSQLKSILRIRLPDHVSKDDYEQFSFLLSLAGIDTKMLTDNKTDPVLLVPGNQILRSGQWEFSYEKIENEKYVQVVTGVFLPGHGIIADIKECLCKQLSLGYSRIGKEIMVRLDPGSFKRVIDWLSYNRICWNAANTPLLESNRVLMRVEPNKQDSSQIVGFVDGSVAFYDRFSKYPQPQPWSTILADVDVKAILQKDTGVFRDLYLIKKATVISL